MAHPLAVLGKVNRFSQLAISRTPQCPWRVRGLSNKAVCGVRETRLSSLSPHPPFCSASVLPGLQACLSKQPAMRARSVRTRVLISETSCKQEVHAYHSAQRASGCATLVSTHRRTPVGRGCVPRFVHTRRICQENPVAAECRRPRGRVRPQPPPGTLFAAPAPPIPGGTVPRRDTWRNSLKSGHPCPPAGLSPRPSYSVSEGGAFHPHQGRIPFGAPTVPLSPATVGNAGSSSCHSEERVSGWSRGDLFGALGSLRSKHSSRSSSKNPLALSAPKNERQEKVSRKPEQPDRREKRTGLLDELMSTFESFLARETQKRSSSASVLGTQRTSTRSDADLVLSRFQAAIQPGGWDLGIPLVPFLLLGPFVSLLVYAFLWKSLWRPLKREERAGRHAATQAEENGVRGAAPKPFSLSLVPLSVSDLLSHVGPFLAKHVESRGVCERALRELQGPPLAREAKGSSLAALQSMLQYPSIADRLCSTKIRSPPLHASASSCAPGTLDPSPVETDKETQGERERSKQETEGEESRNEGDTDKTPLEIVLSVFVGQNLPEGIVKQSTEWLMELSSLCTILRHTLPEDRAVPYDHLLLLVNANASLWGHEPSFEELRARVLLKLLENKANALAVYDREIPQLQARLVEGDSGHREELERPFAGKTAPSGGSAPSADSGAVTAENDAPPEHAPNSLPVSDASEMEKENREEEKAEPSPRLVLDYLLNPSPYTTPDSIFLQLWPVGQRIRAGEPEHALRRAVKLVRFFVETRDALENSAHSPEAARAGTNSVSLSSKSSFWNKLTGSESQSPERDDEVPGNAGRSVNAHTLAVKDTDFRGVPTLPFSSVSHLFSDSSSPSPRRSPPWCTKVFLRELESDFLCVLSVVFLGVFSRKGGGENLFGEIGKIALTGLRALRGLAILETAYHLETKFIHSPAYYEATDSDMIKQSLGLATFNGLLAAAVFRTHKYVLLPFFLLRLRDMFAMDFRI
ncbi:conserved hypothetical protein [Neospora caninum Liverpool]|uniref:Uncharacterized protein n=1 Tax=Neospora caninum (strain Liverpool) TaxID=572307 RepID=F0V817_NEOCL|nr:conserved hypothetical protein [Neospora caninum Liverpool]CBZ49858.1 conserved hypothetical protein [Neospora caninum Liverpool]CEL64447.1 TPA: hypothetical protein BN1204_003430 [Neospora caninum Liverpool]|eukprot:XP_003879893.1 conserved hypothetical protein [Neospora caninum Liverpool]